MFIDPGPTSFISPLAVRLPAEQIAALRDDPETPGWVPVVCESGMGRALLRYAHHQGCGHPACLIGQVTPRAEIETWIGGMGGSTTGMVMSLLSEHPTVMARCPQPRLPGMEERQAMLFYAVFMVFELRGSPEGFEPVLEVVGREAPRLLAGFDLGLPIPRGCEIEGVWQFGARGFG